MFLLLPSHFSNASQYSPCGINLLCLQTNESKKSKELLEDNPTNANSAINMAHGLLVPSLSSELKLG